MYDFTKKNPDRPIPTKEAILKHVSVYEIFKYYCPRFEKVRKPFLSPLRNEKNPSFAIYVNKNGELFFNDFVLGSGDFITFLQERYGLTVYQALSKVAIDFNLEHLFNCAVLPEYLKGKEKPKKYEYDVSKEKKVNISIKSRKFEDSDLKFWKQFGITLKTLRKYSVAPVSHIFIGDKIVTADKYAYSFAEFKDGYTSYTIYQPFSKNHKWLKDHDSSVWYGWDQLPKKGDSLIITKSRKDIMSIDEVLGVPATGLQNELILPKPQVVQELITRFTDIYVLYDNDFDKEENVGRIFGKKLAERFCLIQIEIPQEYLSKDFSDLVKNHGIEKSKEVYQEILNNVIYF